jgi:hypothetical protein
MEIIEKWPDTCALIGLSRGIVAQGELANYSGKLKCKESLLNYWADVNPRKKFWSKFTNFFESRII